MIVCYFWKKKTIYLCIQVSWSCRQIYADGGGSKRTLLSTRRQLFHNGKISRLWGTFTLESTFTLTNYEFTPWSWQAEEPPVGNLEVDHDYFYDILWPMLAHRVTAFEQLKVVSSWAGYYETTSLDCNAIIGAHPYYPTIFWAAGFSGHGIQMAPGVGKVVSEMILQGSSRTVDVTRLGWQRVINNQPDLHRLKIQCISSCHEICFSRTLINTRRNVKRFLLYQWWE